MLVQYRYSETDFVAYLMTLGYKIIKIETTYSKTSGKRTFAYVEGEKEELIKLFEDFHNDEIQTNLFLFIRARRQIVKMMKQSFGNSCNKGLITNKEP